eukprot:gb/GECH01001751.1/.p1 GENE.gb/GECH01001751.1/~~gb/GECH01001751.1/.p1  ORF type:complete len:186 (+),score=67.17 gb/GECH01001751.1/:1-558(+)
MGGRHSSLQNSDFEDLHLKTHYDRKEIKQLYRQFKEEAPKGEIPQEDFHKITDLMGIDDKFVTKLVFHAFDTNHDGSISFDEFVNAMSVMTRGTPDEKVEFAFQLYDLNHDGFISKEELLEIIQGLQRALGDLVSVQGEEFDSPEKLVDRIFAQMDVNQDGKISLDEYKEGSLKNPSIVQGLGLF